MKFFSLLAKGIGIGLLAVTAFALGLALVLALVALGILVSGLFVMALATIFPTTFASIMAVIGLTLTPYQTGLAIGFIGAALGAHKLVGAGANALSVKVTNS